MPPTPKLLSDRRGPMAGKGRRRNGTIVSAELTTAKQSASRVPELSLKIHYRIGAVEEVFVQGYVEVDSLFTRHAVLNENELTGLVWIPLKQPGLLKMGIRPLEGQSDKHKFKKKDDQQ